MRDTQTPASLGAVPATSVVHPGAGLRLRLWLGLLLAGGIAVPVDLQSRPEHIAYVLEQTNAKDAFASARDFTAASRSWVRAVTAASCAPEVCASASFFSAAATRASASDSFAARSAASASFSPMTLFASSNFAVRFALPAPAAASCSRISES